MSVQTPRIGDVVVLKFDKVPPHCESTGWSPNKFVSPRLGYAGRLGVVKLVSDVSFDIAPFFVVTEKRGYGLWLELEDFEIIDHIDEED